MNICTCVHDCFQFIILFFIFRTRKRHQAVFRHEVEMVSIILETLLYVKANSFQFLISFNYFWLLSKTFIQRPFIIGNGILPSEGKHTLPVTTGLNNVCACASCHGASDCARPKYHNNPYENGGVFKNSFVDPGFL